MVVNVEEYLRKQKENAKNDEISDKWYQLEQFHQKKLWHQLARLLNELVYAGFLKNVDTQQFYQNFIAEFEHRINPVTLVRIVMPIARAISEPLEAVKFLQKIQTTVKNDNEAVVLCQTVVIEMQLKHVNTVDKGKKAELLKVRALIEEAQKGLDELPGVTQTHGDFYKVSAAYLRENGDFTGYYKEALRFLGCTDLAKFSGQEKVDQALCLSLAALLGDDVYNFGELLAHPILKALQTKEHQWLVDLLYAFNSGDLKKFEALRGQWTTQADLAKNDAFLGRKVRLLSLMEMAYIRPPTERHLTFAAISKNANVPVVDVEYLVMKALSLGLVRGSIDQVDERVSLSWVQPRVLDKTQVDAMAARVKTWCGDVESMHRLAEREADEILTH